MKYCQHCGTPNEDDSLYCQSCGKRIEEDPQPNPSYSQPAAHPVQSTPDWQPEPAGSSGHSSQQPPRKKSKTWIWAIVVFLVLALAAGGAYWYFVMEKGGSSQHVVVTEEEISQTYVAAQDIPYYEESFSSEGQAGGLAAGRLFTITLVQENEDGDIWAQMEDGNWIYLSEVMDSLIPQEELPELTDEGKTYTVLKEMPVYVLPYEFSKPTDTLEHGEVVYIYTLGKIDDQIWGKISDDHWVLIQEGDVSYLESSSKVASSSSVSSSEALSQAGSDSVLVTLPTTPKIKSKNRYSGVVVIQMILESQGVNLSQAQIAEALGTDGSQGTSYADLEKTLNSLLAKYDIPASYSSVFAQKGDVTGSMEQAFFNTLTQNLQDGYPTIVFLDKEDGETTYALVYGKIVDSDNVVVSYQVCIPSTDTVESVVYYTPMELLGAMEYSQYFLYLG